MEINEFYRRVKAAEDMTRILEREKGMRCEFWLMEGSHLSEINDPIVTRDNNGNPIRHGDNYFVVTCKNNYRYFINVTADSVVTACAEVFAFIQNK